MNARCLIQTHLCYQSFPHPQYLCHFKNPAKMLYFPNIIISDIKLPLGHKIFKKCFGYLSNKSFVGTSKTDL